MRLYEPPLYTPFRTPSPVTQLAKETWIDNKATHPPISSSAQYFRLPLQLSAPDDEFEHSVQYVILLLNYSTTVTYLLWAWIRVVWNWFSQKFHNSVTDLIRMYIILAFSSIRLDLVIFVRKIGRNMRKSIRNERTVDRKRAVLSCLFLCELFTNFVSFQ